MTNYTSYFLAWAIFLSGLATALTVIMLYHTLAWTPGSGEHLSDNPAHILIWAAALAWMLAASLGGAGLWRLIERTDASADETTPEPVEQ